MACGERVRITPLELLRHYKDRIILMSFVCCVCLEADVEICLTGSRSHNGVEAGPRPQAI